MHFESLDFLETENQYPVTDCVLEEILVNSMEPEGGVRKIEAQVRSVFENALLQKELRGNVKNALDIETVRKVLAEARPTDKNPIGFIMPNDGR